MANRVYKFVLCSWCIALLAGSALGATKRSPVATRISFKRGESSATASGMLTSKRLKQAFLIGAKAGQDLSVAIKARTSDGLNFANFMIFDPARKSIATDDGGAARVRLKQTGDYRIEVTPPGSFYRWEDKTYKELRFVLSVRVD
jgi:hypothetical protein